MNLSKLFTKTRKEVSKDETAINAKFLERAGFIKKEMAGVYSYLPLGLMMLRRIENIIREEINAIGGQEILMPTLTSIESYKTTKRDKLDVLFKTKLYNDSEFVLNQSHEEVVVPLTKQFISSYRDLPLYIYQIQNKFRNEQRAKSGMLRGREFIMKDLYSFHTDEKDLDEYYELAKKVYFKLFKRMGLEPILTLASGGTFSKYSHEFQVLTEAGEDEIYVCKKCNIAVNKEIISEHKFCPECKSRDLKKEKSIEIGNIFKLKTKYSQPFDLTYQDKNGKDHIVIMGCYGIGIGRAMGTIVEVHYDEAGMILPESVAPFKFHLIILNLKSGILNLKKVIEKLGGEENCLIDDREISAGQKFADADLLGMPYRVIISEKTLKEDSVEVKKRNEKESKLIKIYQLK